MPSPIEHSSAVVLVTAPAYAAVWFAAWPFGLAFAAGCIALIYLSKMLVTDAIKSIIGSTFIGGALAQLTAKPLITIVSSIYAPLAEWAKEGDTLFTVIAILAIVIGLSAQKLMPKLLDRAGRQIDSDKGAPQ